MATSVREVCPGCGGAKYTDKDAETISAFCRVCNRKDWVVQAQVCLYLYNIGYKANHIQEFTAEHLGWDLGKNVVYGRIKYAVNELGLVKNRVFKLCTKCRVSKTSDEFPQIKGGTEVRQPCKECKKNDDRIYTKLNLDIRRRNTNIWRAKKHGVEFETVLEHKVYARDRFICKLCDKEVDFGLKWPDLMSRTLDHIIPLSKGGTHTFDNVQLAHYSCNSKKNNKIVESVVRPIV